MTDKQTSLTKGHIMSTTMALIPGTSSVAHLRENVAAAALALPADAIDELDTIGR